MEPRNSLSLRRRQFWSARGGLSSLSFFISIQIASCWLYGRFFLSGATSQQLPGCTKNLSEVLYENTKNGARIGLNGEPGLGSGSVKQRRDDRGAGAI
jgi:hypothetical protein